MMKMKINRIVSFFMKYYIVSGGFDPIHEGHIAMINEAHAAATVSFCCLIPTSGCAAKKAKTL